MTAAVCTGIPLRLDQFHSGQLPGPAVLQLGSRLRDLGAEELLDAALWAVVGDLDELVFNNVGGIFTAPDAKGWWYTVQSCGTEWFAGHRSAAGSGSLGLWASMALAQLACERHRRQRRLTDPVGLQHLPSTTDRGETMGINNLLSEHEQHLTAGMPDLVAVGYVNARRRDGHGERREQLTVVNGQIIAMPAGADFLDRMFGGAR